MKSKNASFTDLALITFGVIGLEVILVLIESLVYNNFHIENQGVVHNLVHWTITCIVWGVGVWLLHNYAKKSKNFDLFEAKERPTRKTILAVFLLLLLSLVISISTWNFRFKPMVEFNNMMICYGESGVLAFIFQYIYYIFETALIVLIIAFSQKAGEDKFQNKKFPWGGVFLGITWGLMHVLTKDLQTGIMCFVISILFGIVFLLLKKNIRYVYIAIFLMFVL